MIKNHNKNCLLRILGSPVVKTPYFHHRCAGSIPGQGTKIMLCGVIKKKNKKLHIGMGKCLNYCMTAGNEYTKIYDEKM